MSKRYLGFMFICIALFVISGCGAKEKTTVSKTDEISGYSWKATDGSILYLEADGSFKWYLREKIRNDSYYIGTYSVYNGQEAVDYMSTELKEYNVTSEMQMDMIESVEDASLENYYCVVLNNDRCIVDGKNTLREKTVVPYYGFYYAENEFFDLVNLVTENYFQFTKYTE
jgi:hypothetical protein